MSEELKKKKKMGVPKLFGTVAEMILNSSDRTINFGYYAPQWDFTYGAFTNYTRHSDLFKPKKKSGFRGLTEYVGKDFTFDAIKAELDVCAVKHSKYTKDRKLIRAAASKAESAAIEAEGEVDNEIEQMEHFENPAVKAEDVELPLSTPAPDRAALECASAEDLLLRIGDMVHEILELMRPKVEK